MSQGREWHEFWGNLPMIGLVLATAGWLAPLPKSIHSLSAAEPPASATQDPIADDNDPRVKAAVARAAIFLRGKGTGSSPEDWEAEIAKWKKWFRSVRPQAEDEDDVVRN